jgi:hypothetical protein
MVRLKIVEEIIKETPINADESDIAAIAQLQRACTDLSGDTWADHAATVLDSVFHAWGIRTFSVSIWIEVLVVEWRHLGSVGGHSKYVPLLMQVHAIVGDDAAFLEEAVHANAGFGNVDLAPGLALAAHYLLVLANTATINATIRLRGIGVINLLLLNEWVGFK